MIYELKSTDDQFTKPSYIEEIGSYNQLPTPYKMANSKDFFDYLLIETVNYMEYRQVRLLNQPQAPIYNTKIFYFHDKAFAIIKLRDGITVYQIGCQHEWKRTSYGFDKHSLCLKCGTEYTVNSSD